MASTSRWPRRQRAQRSAFDPAPLRCGRRSSRACPRSFLLPAAAVVGRRYGERWRDRGAENPICGSSSTSSPPWPPVCSCPPRYRLPLLLRSTAFRTRCAHLQLAQRSSPPSSVEATSHRAPRRPCREALALHLASAGRRAEVARRGLGGAKSCVRAADPPIARAPTWKSVRVPAPRSTARWLSCLVTSSASVPNGLSPALRRRRQRRRCRAAPPAA